MKTYRVSRWPSSPGGRRGVLSRRTCLRGALVTLLVTPVLAGCTDFLTGPKLDSNPNIPPVGSRDQLLMGVQAAQTIQQTGALARGVAMWMQQMAGTDRQYSAFDLYQHTEADFATEFAGVYVGGGLIDIREIIRQSEAEGDRIYAGIGKVWEALTVGLAADLWGDIPYSEATSESATPALDPQMEVYAAIQALLSEAIADLASGDCGTCTSDIANRDLIYGGDAERWLEAAHTLKARYHLHTAEVLGTPAYAAALAEAAQGISSPANDFRTFHTAAAGEQNMWYQFVFVARDSYTRAGKFLVDLLVARNDPRLPTYFVRAGNGQYAGAVPGSAANDAVHSNLNPAQRGAPDFRQPIVTWAENQLIWAEAALATGDPVTARAKLNEVRAAAGLGEVSSTLVGAALLEAIITEKYIALFQSPEVWSDYRRTCFPALTPAGTATAIPGRFLYGNLERNANPNIPAPSEQPVRNANDPVGCG